MLHLSNLAQFDATRDILTTVENAAFTTRFGYVSGSWCCAPNVDKQKGQPQSAYFNLLRAKAYGGARSG